MQSLAFGLTAVADGYKAPPPPLTKAALDGVAQRWRCCRDEFKRYAAVPEAAPRTPRLSACPSGDLPTGREQVADISSRGKGGDVGEAARAASRAKRLRPT